MTDLYADSTKASPFVRLCKLHARRVLARDHTWPELLGWDLRKLTPAVLERTFRDIAARLDLSDPAVPFDHAADIALDAYLEERTP